MATCCTCPGVRNPSAKTAKNKSNGFYLVFRRGGIDQTRHKRCRRAGRDMENTFPKFGGWGLCATCGRESEVKATENKKWMVTEKKRNPAKRGLEKQK